MFILSEDFITWSQSGQRIPNADVRSKMSFVLFFVFLWGGGCSLLFYEDHLMRHHILTHIDAFGTIFGHDQASGDMCLMLGGDGRGD